MTIDYKISDMLEKDLEEKDMKEALKNLVKTLRKKITHYTWVGVYMVEGDELVLWAWDGNAATEHTRIPIGEGICGLAASIGESVVVDDVSKDTKYLMCFPATKSEIVVPIIGEEVHGEIDIDSDKLAAFTSEDQSFLELLAALIAQKIEE